MNPKPTVEVYDEPDGFRFRLVGRDGKKTGWANYTGVCYLDGWVTATEYYLPRTLALAAITPDEFCKLTATGELR